MRFWHLALAIGVVWRLVLPALGAAQTKVLSQPSIDVRVANSNKATYSHLWKTSSDGTTTKEWMEFHSALPENIIRDLAQGKPIQGLERLSLKNRYEVRVDAQKTENPFRPGLDAPNVLDMIGERIGFRVHRKVTAVDVLIIRNDKVGRPGSWLDTGLPEARGASAEEKIAEIDSEDHLYRAYAVTMREFRDWLQNHSEVWLIDQTSLAGYYDFTFQFADKDVPNLLKTMGFGVVTTKRMLECLIVEPAAPTGSGTKPD